MTVTGSWGVRANDNYATHLRQYCSPSLDDRSQVFKLELWGALGAPLRVNLKTTPPPTLDYTHTDASRNAPHAGAPACHRVL